MTDKIRRGWVVIALVLVVTTIEACNYGSTCRVGQTHTVANMTDKTMVYNVNPGRGGSYEYYDSVHVVPAGKGLLADTPLRGICCIMPGGMEDDVFFSFTTSELETVEYPTPCPDHGDDTHATLKLYNLDDTTSLGLRIELPCYTVVTAYSNSDFTNIYKHCLSITDDVVGRMNKDTAMLSLFAWYYTQSEDR